MVRESKNNKLGIVAGTTGGHSLIHNVKTGEVEQKIPPAEKVEVPTLGLAKASPAFKKVEPKAKASKTEESQALKENEVKTEGGVSAPSSEGGQKTTPST